MTDLVITNYDNFKDLSYFVNQHEKALGIMSEVTEFYLSFLKSKLICNYEIEHFPGKVILEKFRGLNDKDYCRDYEKEYPLIVDGARLQNKEGYWYTVSNVKETKEKWSSKPTYIKHYNIKYDVKRPYYELAFDIYFYNSSWTESELEKQKELYERSKQYFPGKDTVYAMSKTSDKPYDVGKKIKELEEKIALDNQHEIDYKEINGLVNADNYKNQTLIKSKLADYFHKYHDKCFYTLDPKNGLFKLFASEKELTEYQFKISDDKKYLIVYQETFDGGTRTDRWKTFEYKGVRHDEHWFEVATGNFYEHKNYFVKDWETEMNVHNGWHPYDDD